LGLGRHDSVMSVVPPPDYDWETDGATKPAGLSCVSLGCSCAVAACLSHLKLRDAAYPFDWNRTTIEGVIHFLRTGFADFLQFLYSQAFPGGKATGGTSYHGAHHSIWHEDMATHDGTEKYQRRISRFFLNAASRLLFIRVLNAHTEVANALQLLQILQVLFARSEVFLLLIVVCQPAVGSFVVDGTRGRLLVHCIAQWPHDVLVYQDAILFGHRQASAADLWPLDPSVRLTRSCEEILAFLLPFFGGPPQQVPFNPQPICVPMFISQDKAQAWALQQQLAAAYAAVATREAATTSADAPAKAVASAPLSRNCAVAWPGSHFSPPQTYSHLQPPTHSNSQQPPQAPQTLQPQQPSQPQQSQQPQQLQPQQSQQPQQQLQVTREGKAQSWAGGQQAGTGPETPGPASAATSVSEFAPELAHVPVPALTPALQA